MKKVFVLAVAAFLFTGAIAQDGHCSKGKGCCKKGDKKEVAKKAVVKKDKAPVAVSKKA